MKCIDNGTETFLRVRFAFGVYERVYEFIVNYLSSAAAVGEGLRIESSTITIYHMDVKGATKGATMLDHREE